MKATCLKFSLTVVYIIKDIVEIQPKKGLLGKTFKGDAKFVIQGLSELIEEKDILKAEKDIKENGYHC